jgi:glutathione synthase/RimK-type ligase-like ATP-grasp enzyme
MRRRFLNRALVEIATRRGLLHEERSGGWIVRVGNGHRHLEAYGYLLSLNDGVAAAAAVARDKAAAAERLELDDIPTVATALVLNDLRQAWIDGREARAGFDDAMARLDPPFVVKPNEGSSGVGVTRADDDVAAWVATERLLATEPAVVVQPVVAIASEERWVLLGDEPLLRYAKSPAAGPVPMYNLALGATITSWGVDEGSDVGLVLARRARRALGLATASVDLLTDVDGRTIVMEVNAGWSFEHLVRIRPDTRPTAVAAYEAAVDVALGLRSLRGVVR